MTITRELIRQVRALDTYDLRRLQILIRGLLMEPGATAADLEPPEVTRGSVTFRQEMVKCGKKTCTKCPHGPYWYAYWREDGRLRSRYVGKQLPAENAQDAARDDNAHADDPADRSGHPD